MANAKRTRQNKKFADKHGNITRSEWAKQKKDAKRQKLLESNKTV